MIVEESQLPIRIIVRNIDGVDTILEEIEPHSKYQNLILFLACLIISVPAADASSVGAYNITLTQDYVKATALCSCGSCDYTYHTNAFMNYCPHCKSYGNFIFNPKGVPEGEWTCTKCGSDYCAADGYEKMPNSKYRLIPYNEPETQNHTVSSTNVNGLMIDMDKYKDNNFLNFYHLI